jgi:hypothetical protein
MISNQRITKLTFWTIRAVVVTLCISSYFWGSKAFSFQNLPTATATITINSSTTFQTMVGWEATAQGGQDYDATNNIYPSYPSPSWPQYKNALLAAMLDVGINRLRLEIRLDDVNATGYSANGNNPAIQPSTASAGQWHFERIDRTMDEIGTPYRNMLAARGEQLYLTICVIDFRSTGYHAEDSPSEYAFFVNKIVDHFSTRQGYLPNAIEACLEPDAASNLNWNATKLANNIVQANSSLVSHGFTGIRWVAPSVANGTQATTWYVAMKSANSNVTALLDEISYHRYTSPNNTELATLRDAAAADGNTIAMLEWIGATYTTLHDDLKIGRGTSWQQFTLTFPYQGAPDNGEAYFMVNTSNWTVSLGSRTKLLRQYFKFIRRGAVRLSASTSDSNLDPLAFRNTNGSYVTVIKAAAAGSFSLQGLPAGLYGIKYTTDTQYDINLPDVNIASGQSLGSSIPAAGVITVYAKTQPLAVKLASFEATGYDNGNFLEWQTGFETDNLGFNLYRDEAGKRVAVNNQMIAGSALVAGSGVQIGAGRTYRWWDAGAKSGSTKYWIEDIDLNGNRTLHGPVMVNHLGGAPTESRSAALLSQVGNVTSGVSRPLPVTAPLAVIRPEQTNLINTLAGQAAVKLAIKHDGFYRVAGTDLVAAGLDPKVDPERLQLYADGKPIPINVVSDKQGQVAAVEFYGVGLDTASTDARIYWLTASPEVGLRITKGKDTGFSTAATSFLATVERKDHTIYFSALRNGERENFFGAVIAGQPVDQMVALPNVDATTNDQATVEVALQGVTRLPHQVWVYINGAFTGEMQFTGQSQGVGTFTVPQSLLSEGDNLVRLAAHGGSGDVSLVDYIHVNYWHTFAVDDNRLQLTASGGQALTVSGFTSAAVRVFDVTDPDAVEELAVKVEPQKSGYAANFASIRTGARRFLALADEQADHPSSIAANQISNLRATSHTATLVIVTRRDFFSAFDRLAKLRASQGIKPELVSIEDIYDEFSFGNKSPQAVKDFLQYARANWKKGPRFVLLGADSSYDAKNYLGFGDWDIAPAKLIDTELMETASDDWFADFNNDGVAELAVGRLPVRTADEAAGVVAKIISYETVRPSEEMLLVADINDTFNFEGANAELRGLIPTHLQVNEINRGQLDAAKARSQLIEAINRGPKLVNYFGHGSVDLWRSELLSSNDMRMLENQRQPSLFVMMSCLNGYSHDPGLESLAKALMKVEHGGAVAVWSSSGMTEPEAQVEMNRAMYRLMFAESGRAMALGEILGRAKAQINAPDVRRTWILLGDPTMKIK